jgi:hypothetical protein
MPCCRDRILRKLSNERVFGRESGAGVDLILFGGYALLPAQPFQYDADLLFS